MQRNSAVLLLLFLNLFLQAVFLLCRILRIPVNVTADSGYRDRLRMV